MDINKTRMINILKTLANDCEKLASSTQRYIEFRDEFTDEEWEQLVNSLNEKELDCIEELNERYWNHLEIINNLKI